MKFLLLALLIHPLFADDTVIQNTHEDTSEYDGRFPVVTPSGYEKQAQEERIQNEKAGMEIRKNMRKASGLKRNDPLLRKDDEPFDQAEEIMKPRRR